jgi:hypothetical protein
MLKEQIKVHLGERGFAPGPLLVEVDPGTAVYEEIS